MMKTEIEIRRYVRCLEKWGRECGCETGKAQVEGAIEAASWILGQSIDPDGYAELLALDKADDKRMDQNEK